ncbi:AAA family ATPase [Pseudomonas panipatensis]|uniref:AAA domain-containing protein n=1 Tax=Pseudomonas panipatensis TaxID=428992 RepID=A0A1G8N7J1_9PSED|nr:AAA family ATPase [Pseudomonas panipatensis]SDI76172.1 AAA domain-containing protein [Pseudomonas panipatensis]SMP45470.1 AAA domain-containing protein [Pseudomonas panipatensis]
MVKHDYSSLISGAAVSCMLSAAQAKIDWLFEGLIEDDRDKGHQWLISGEPKSGKSRLVLQLAIAAAEGKSFLEFCAKKRSRVLYFNFELSKGVIGRRALEFFGGDEQRMRGCEGWLYVVNEWSFVDVLDKECFEHLKGFVESVQPDLVIWDVLKRMSHVDENSNVEMTRVMHAIREISAKRTHLIVHHARKEQFSRNAGARGLRGASAIHAEADGVISIAEMGAGHTLEFSVRSIPSLDGVRLLSNGISFQIEPEQPPVEKQGMNLEIAFEGKEWLCRKEILGEVNAQLGLAESAADRMLELYVNTGLLAKKKEGRKVFYSLVSKAA